MIVFCPSVMRMTRLGHDKASHRAHRKKVTIKIFTKDTKGPRGHWGATVGFVTFCYLLIRPKIC